MINQNSIRSNFSNYQRKDPHLQISFNLYQQQSQNSQSLGFTLFGQLGKNNVHSQRTDMNAQKNLSDQNIDMKDMTIGFNQIPSFFDNSMNFTTQQYKMANIKKAPTFQCVKGYLNFCQQNLESNQEIPIKVQQRHQDYENCKLQHQHENNVKVSHSQKFKQSNNSLSNNPKPKNISKSIKSLSKAKATQGKLEQKQLQHKSQQCQSSQSSNCQQQLKQQQQSQKQSFSPSNAVFKANNNVHQGLNKKKYQPKATKNNKPDQKSINIQSNCNMLSNLKSIAKFAYEGIKKEKITSYKSLSDIMLNEMLTENKLRDSGHQILQKEVQQSTNNRSINADPHIYSHPSQQKIIQQMIKNKSFSQIQRIKPINLSVQMNKKTKKTKINSNIDQNQYQQLQCHQNNIKNIRRRLYDAINVMMAAKIIQKDEKGHLIIKKRYNLAKENEDQKDNMALKEKNKNKAKEMSNKFKIQLKQSKLEQQQPIQPKHPSLIELQKLVNQQKQRIQTKKKYRQQLISKYITLLKNIQRNKTLQRKSTAEDKKLYFPLVFANVETPCKINIQNQNQNVTVNSQDLYGIISDLDLLGYFYWVDRDQIKLKEQELVKKVNQMNLSKKKTVNLKIQQMIDEEEDCQLNKKGRKMVKLQQPTIG